jgi:hypothetical protein
LNVIIEKTEDGTFQLLPNSSFTIFLRVLIYVRGAKANENIFSKPIPFYIWDNDV